MDTGLLILRLVLGLTLAVHGLQKLFGWFGGLDLSSTGAAFAALGYRPGKLFALLAGLAEAAGGVLLAIGFLTPLAAMAVMSAMLGATLSAHLRNGFWNSKDGVEYTLLLGVLAAGIAFTGGGSYSVDHLLGWNLGGVVWGEVAVAVTIAAGLPTELYRRRNLAQVAPTQTSSSTAD